MCGRVWGREIGVVGHFVVTALFGSRVGGVGRRIEGGGGGRRIEGGGNRTGGGEKRGKVKEFSSSSMNKALCDCD